MHPAVEFRGISKHFGAVKTSKEDLANMMVGRPIENNLPRGAYNPGAPVLAVRDLQLTDDQGVTLLNKLNFTLRAGEIVAIAGVSGNGQSELMEILSGMRLPTSGQVDFEGKALPYAGRSDADGLPLEFRHLGIGHVPEDRLRDGVIKNFSVMHNTFFGYQDRVKNAWGLIDFKGVAERCAGLLKAFDVRPANPDLRIGLLSGGNQQKVVIAREVLAKPKLMLVGQPTRGVDIGTIESIHTQLLALRDAGVAILLVSVELEEVRALADRILVMCGGSITGELKIDEFDTTRIGLLMAFVLPVLNLLSALLVAALVIHLLGEDPVDSMRILINSAIVNPEGLSYTLFYASTFIFTGLSVSIAMQAGLFNIGSEGQMYIGGLGLTLAMLAFDATLPWWLLIPCGILGAALFGALWGFLPGYLQAKRGSHIVVTTIMFNFIAASLMNFFIVKYLIPPGEQNTASRVFSAAAEMPRLNSWFPVLGDTPLNVSFLLAIVALAVYGRAARQTTSITTVPADATTTLYNDSGNNTGVSGDTNPEFGRVIAFVESMGANASTEPAKRFYKYARPWRWSSDVKVEPTLLPARSTTPATDGGYTSGHSAEAVRNAVAMAYLVPERFHEMLARGLELGENRIMAGMHSPLDVISGRMLGQASAVGNIAAASKDTRTAAYNQAHQSLMTAVGATTPAQFAAFARSQGTDKDRFADYAANQLNYQRRLVFGFTPIGSTTQPAVVPKGAEVLLETRLPYLSDAQRRVVLKTTALSSGYPAMDDAEGYGRLNLFAAGSGYGAFSGDVDVTMDAALGGFHALDVWRNPIAGAGKLTKRGSGTPAPALHKSDC
eukprot:gene32180-39740_t